MPHILNELLNSKSKTLRKIKATKSQVRTIETLQQEIYFRMKPIGKEDIALGTANLQVAIHEKFRHATMDDNRPCGTQ